jgi:hypothetical protein
MADKVLEDISKKLDQLIALTAANAVKGMKQTPAILTLGAIGLDRNLIAQIVDTTPATVSVRLSESKKKNAPEKKAAPASVSAQSDAETPKR